MKILSEKTGKYYQTVEECLKAEKEFDEKVAAEKAAREKALAEVKAKKEAEIAERKADAEKVEQARQNLIKAKKEYLNVLGDFNEKHGAYHFSIKMDNKDIDDIFSNIIDTFWF